ncbi:MAG: adenosylcobalamin-dependent ribonucleoside-diphosphate reductase, partial [Haloarculaceae archaeon]
EFQDAMERLAFMPNSPTLMNAGDELQQLSACFVDSPEDQIDDIHQTAKEAAEVFQSGGGMGYAFWRLRPYGDPVGSTGGIASGPITFMRTYDQMCFPPGTRVLTPDGQRPIEDVSKGDLVVDKDGNRQPVVETMERRVDEELVEITPERLNREIRATEEHPFKVARDDGYEWVDAGDLQEDDLLVLGHTTSENDLELDTSLSLDDIATGPLVFTDGGVTINREYYGATKGTRPGAFEDEVPVDDFATLAGWYLAEGCVVYRRGMPSEVTFTLNSEERGAATEIQESLASFGVPSRVETVEDRNTMQVHAEHSSFAEFVDGVFGTGASTKTVPAILWTAPPETQASVLEALFAGDGRLAKRGESQRVKLKLANEEIIDFAFQAALRCGVLFSRHDRDPEDRLPTYEIGASISSALGTPLECLFGEVPENFSARDRTKQAHGRDVVAIDSVAAVEYEGPVYNAEVAGTHTYVAEDVVVHNCETIAQGGARRGAQMGVMRVSHPDVIQFIHAKNKDVSLAHTLKLDDPDDFTHNSFAEALEEARDLIDDEGRVPKHLRNAVEGHLSNFNISVGVTDGFMEAVKNDAEYTFTNPRTGEPHVATEQTKELYEMFDLGEHVEVGEVLSVPANLIWERIVEGAHENGEPGVIYLERVNKEHSFDTDKHPEHTILATNPCGEQPLEEYEACNLGHINLSTLAAREAPDWRVWADAHADEYDSQAEAVEAFLEEAIDTEEFDRRIELGTRFLENVVTMSDFPVDEIEDKVRSMRKIGLGVMGLAQLYVQLGLKYGSEEANEIARQLMRRINHGSKWASHELAEERGPFADWADSKYAEPTAYPDWFERQTGLDPGDWADGFPVRNHNTTTIAPTGTTSMVGNTTGGCEPIYNVAYYKNVSDDVQGDEMLVEFDDYFLRTLEANDIDVEVVKREATEQMAENAFEGVESLSTVPDSISELFVTTGDLTAKQHASVQTACQEGVDSAISKTVNAPHESTVEDAKEVFEYIYDNGGKGVTYYRDGTRSKQVLTTRAQNKEYADESEAAEVLVEQIQEVFGSIEGFVESEEVAAILDEEIESILGLADGDDTYAQKRARPDVLHGVTQRIDTGYGKLYVNINEDPEADRPFELFANIGNSGGFTASFTESLAKTISTALRAGVDPREIADELQGIRSPKVAWDKGEQIQSIPDAIGTAMRRYLDGEVEKVYPQQQTLEETAGDPEGSEADRGEASTSASGGTANDENDDAPGNENAERAPVEPETDGGAVTRDAGPAAAEATSGPSAGGADTDQQALIDAGESPECPECGSLSLYYSEGCKTCESCGWSEC